MSQDLIATRRVLQLGLVLLGVGGWALHTGSQAVAAALLPLTGVVLVAFLEVFLPLPRRLRRRVATDRAVAAGDVAEIEVAVDRVPFAQNLVLEDALDEGLDAAGAPRRLRRAGAEATMRYPVHVRRRGLHLVGPARAARVGALGLFERSVVLGDTTIVQALPIVGPRVRPEVRPRPPAHAGRAARSARRGPGEEFHGIRDYQSTDTMGDVNWKATARTQRLMVNDHMPDEPPRYLLYVDVRVRGLEPGSTDVFERTLDAAGLVVDALLESRAHVGMVLLSLHSVFLVPNGGTNQRRRLKRLLMDAQPGDEVGLDQLAVASIPHIPSHADAILITPHLDDPKVDAAVGLFRGRHGAVRVLAPCFPRVPETGPEAVAQNLAAALLDAEQAVALARLARIANGVGQWSQEEAVSVALRRLGLTVGARG